ncbi:MAG: hypothetical protein COA78_13190 [Blastopirellula sp.]|nr:MAG: hypothetical protein COA78_13190 [Blastopirellula sp.]
MLRNFVVISIAVLFSLLFSANSHAQKYIFVGEFGDFSRMEIKGLQSVSLEKVREALSRDPQAILAAHPLAPLENLTSTISQRLQTGFTRAGFVQPNIWAKLDFEQERVTVQITEGVRLHNGLIQIENAKKIDTEQLLQRLTEKYPTRDAVTPVFHEQESGLVSHWLDKDGKMEKLADPVWEAGQPTKLDQQANIQYEKKIAQALEDIGIRNSTFDIEFRQNLETAQVDLIIYFRNEGTLATLNQITVQGNERNSLESIINYLDIPIGTTVTRSVGTLLRYKLWSSGRFMESDVELAHLPNSSDFNLILRVKESPYSPPLDQALTEEEQLLLKMRRLLINPKHWVGDFVTKMRIEQVDATIIHSPEGGLLLSLQSVKNKEQPPLTLVYSPQEIGWYPSSAESYLRTPPVKMPLTVSLSFELNKQLDPEKPFNAQFGVGFNSEDVGISGLPFSFVFSMPPSAALSFIQARKIKSQWRDNLLILDSPKDHLEIERETGRLVRHSGPTKTGNFEITFEKGAFKKALKATHESAVNRENEYRENRPLHSFFEFMSRQEITNEWIDLFQLEEIFEEFTQHDRDSLGIWSKFIAKGLLDPIDEFIMNKLVEDESDEKFEIPWKQPEDPMVGLRMMALVLVPVADDLFPRHSWAWTVWRETSFYVAGQAKYLDGQMGRAYQSDEFGPVGLGVVSYLIEFKSPKIAQLFSQRGLQKLSIEEFRKDYRLLLDNQTLAGKCFMRACDSLRSLNHSEYQELLTHISDDWRPGFEAYSEIIRQEPKFPLYEVVPDAWDAAWKAGLNDSIRELLLKHAP